MKNCERCGVASIEVQKKFCVSCRVINNVERMRATRRKQKANIVQHKEAFYTLSESLKKDRINFEKSVMTAKIPLVQKNYERFLKTRDNTTFSIVMKNAKNVVADWEKHFYEGRIMTNEVKIAMRLLGK